MQRSVLLQLVELGGGNDDGWQAMPTELRSKFAIPGRITFGFDENLRRWVESATPAELDRACGVFLRFFPRTDYNLRFVVERNRSGNVPRASVTSVNIGSLADALHWMVWQDEFLKHPFQFCEECEKLFKPRTHHARKFCDNGCGHRRASREFERMKRKSEKEANGTHKTR